MKRPLALAVVLLCASCGGDEAAEQGLPPVDTLCPPILARLEKLDAEIARLSEPSQAQDETDVARTVKPGRLEDIDKAQHDYLRVRSKAAALGCLPS